MSAKRTLRDVDVASKRVLVRVDYNVPQDDTGAITDNSRIRETLPTLRYLLEHSARVILMSHLGRPDGKVVAKLTLAPVAKELERLLGQPVQFARDTVGPDAQAKAAALQPGQVLLLENVRFHPEEEANNPAFAAQLAKLGDLYVNDAFGTAHRAHASTEGVAKHLPAVAGLLMERELEALGQVLENPQRPLTAVIGGAKVSSKIGVLEHLLTKVDAMIIGGGMACTFLKAQGLEIGKSLVEPDRLDLAKELIARAEARGVRFLLPVDAVVADKFDASARTTTVDVDQIPPDMMMLDIGSKTEQVFAQAVKESKTIVWNGPMGVFEMEPFAHGTKAVAAAIASSGATTIVGGGDTVAAIEQFSDASHFSHVSTGGGASLEYLEGRTLPGVAALGDR
ncbi:MAG: phosphoglycerate kinase [Chloroflexota bacterium]|nr:phosphoglycerate kinase [Chloroflexota bacterium]